MIIRAKHDGKTSPYVIISRKLIQEQQLPYGAKCLLLLMLSYPDNWTFSEAHLAKVMNEDIQVIINWLEILVQYGYLQKNVTVSYGGTAIPVGWVITEYPSGGSEV